MRRTLTFWALASTALFLGACEGGGGDPGLINPDLLTKCETNKVTTGGYLWTYADRYSVATITPLTDLENAFVPEAGGYEGKGCHIVGTVPGPLPVEDERKDLCEERLYPAAGFGFGFQDKNAPYVLTEDKLGVMFVAKGAPDATTTPPQTTYPVRVAVAQTTTDMAQSAFDDQFTSTCKCTADALASDPVEQKSCFANYNVTVNVTPEWQQCYVYFRDMSHPTWGQDKGFDRAQAIKLQFDMQQPAADPAIPFDVWLDNIEWITEEDEAAGTLPTTSTCGPIPAATTTP